MKYKFIVIVFALLLISCSAIPAEAAPLGTPRATATLAAVAPYHTPTATIGYEATIVSVAGTAAEVERMQVEITAQAEQRAHEKIQMTAQSESRAAEVYNLTAQAAPVSIPLTSTAQVVNWTAIADYNAYASGQLTATKEAPTQIYLSNLALDEAQFAPLNLIVRMFAYLGIGFCGIFLSAFVLVFGAKKDMPTPEAAKPFIVPTNYQPIPTAPETITLAVSPPPDTAYPAGEFIKLPCTPEEFTILVNELEDGRTWGYNQWQGSESPLPFKKFDAIRRASLQNRWIMSVPNANGAVMNTSLGDKVFEAWRENQSAENLEFTESVE